MPYIKNYPVFLLAGLLLIAVSYQAVAQPGAAETPNDDANTSGLSSGAALNFQKADISSVIAAVSKITGRNFIVDPRVRGEVTVFTASDVDKDSIYQTFLAVLDVLGYAAVPMGSAIQIVPEDEAKQMGGNAESVDQANSDVVTRTIKLENINASELIGILRPLMPSAAQIAAYPSANTLILTDRRANVARMERIVENLDRRDTPTLEIVPLAHAQAGEIVSALGQVQQANGGRGGAGNQPLPIVAEPRSNRVIIGGDAETKRRLRSLIERLDVDTAEQATTEVIYLQNAEADVVAPLLERFAQIQSERNGAVGNAGNSVGILANSSINALVVTAPVQTMEAIQDVVRKIDIRRAQILVEAVIAEVSDSQTRQLGVDIAALGDNIAFASLLDPGTIAAVGGAGGLTEGVDTLAFAEQGGTVGGIASDGGSAIAGLIKALARDQNTNILSAPTLVTMDNEEAEISVGQEVPFLTGQFSTSVTDGGSSGGVNPFQTIERKDVGLTLKITPQISQGNTIRLDIAQEMSSISGTQASAVDIVTNKRTLTNTVAVDDGRILVLGGLIDRELQSSETGVPVLKDIPILGSLFRATSTTNNKRNLMIFIRPVIIRDAVDAGYYTQQKYSPMRRVHDASLKKNESFTGVRDRARMGSFEFVDHAIGELIVEGPKPLAYAPGGAENPTLRDFVMHRGEQPTRHMRPRRMPWYRAATFGGCLNTMLALPAYHVEKTNTPDVCDAFNP